MHSMYYQVAAEKTLYFDLPDTNGLKIKGILRGDLNGPVAVMMHGRPGNANKLLQYLGARYMYEHGIATLRLYMYSFEPQTRNLKDCTLQTHADDFDVVVRELRKQNDRRVYAIGHSYGGLTILKSNSKLDGAVLWDPSHGSWWAENRGEQYKDMYPEIVLDNYIIGTAGEGWATPLAAQKYDEQLGDTSGLAAKDYPLKIITAGQGALIDLGERYYKAANQPKDRTILKEAGHGFEESDAVMHALFKETADWLLQYP